MSTKRLAALNHAIQVKKYDLYFDINKQLDHFSGTSEIVFDVLKPASYILVNALEMSIKKAVFGGKEMPVLMDKEEQVLTVFFPTALPVGKEARLTIEFEAPITDKMVGLYRSTHKEAGSEPLSIASTHFEASDARRCFPCIDEPEAKATFNITIRADKEHTVLSNMPVMSVTEDKAATGLSTLTHKFQETVPMSTYLVAFVVGKLASISKSTKGGVKCSVYMVPSLIEQAAYSLDVGVEVLEFYEEYFEIKYPLPKMDFVAIPQFAMGAMENWGLVTYRPSALQYHPAQSSFKAKQRVFSVIAHELAHQWFGNLVTMRWWNDLWLNEGFATWVSFIAQHKFNPTWNSWLQYLQMDTLRGLSFDSLANTHPIEVDVHDPAEVGEIFDAISYSKGSALLQMLNNYIGGETFRVGISKYLKKHQLNNAVTHDLWMALQDESKMPVADVMDCWTKQSGYPTVTVEAVKKSDGKVTVTFEQNRFFLEKPAVADGTLWKIPVSLSVSGKREQAFLMTGRTHSVEIELADSDWLKVNAGQFGFYRVNYSVDLVERLTKAISKGEIGKEDRLGLVSDFYQLSKASVQKITDTFRLVDTYMGETEYIIWSEISGMLGKVRSVFWQHPEVQEVLGGYTRKLFATIHKSLGNKFVSGEDQERSMLRALVIGDLYEAGDKAASEHLLAYFTDLQSGKTKVQDIPSDLRRQVFSAGVATHGKAAAEFMFKLYNDTQVEDVKMSALYSLGYIKKKQDFAYLSDLIVNMKMRSSDMFVLFDALSANFEMRAATLELLEANWNLLEAEYLTTAPSLLGRIVSSTYGCFSDIAVERRMTDFFSNKNVSTIKSTINQTKEGIRISSAMLNFNKADCADQLKNHVAMKA